ncbi:PD-(D/E)XK nuclease family protein [Lagierella sp. ICN-221743]
MHNILNYRNKTRVYEDLKNKVIDLLKEKRQDFIVLLPSQSLINKLMEDLAKEFEVILGLKIFTFDDLVNMNYIDKEDEYKEYYSSILLEKALEDAIAEGVIEDNIFFNSESFVSIANRFNNIIYESNLDKDVFFEKLSDRKPYVAIYELLKKYNHYIDEQEFVDKFKKTERFLKNFENKEGLTKVIIGGFSKFNPLELEILKKLQSKDIDIDIYYLNSYNSPNCFTSRLYEKLEDLNFNVVNSELDLNKWDYETKLIRAEDDFLEIERLAIEVKRDLIDNPKLSSCIILRNPEIIEQICEVFNKSGLELGVNEDIKLIDSQVGKWICNLASLDLNLSEYLLKNYNNPLVFEEKKEILEFEKIITENNFIDVDEIFMFEEFMSLEEFPVIKEKILTLKKNILDIDNNIVFINFILQLLKSYLSFNSILEDEIEYEFYEFLNILNSKFGKTIETLQFNKFINIFKSILKKFKTRDKSKVNYNIELTSFNMFNLLSYDNLYFIGFDDNSYPLRKATNYYFNETSTAEYKDIGLDILNNRENYFFELINFMNIIDESTKKIYFSYSGTEESLVSQFIKFIGEDILEENYGIKDFIRPNPTQVISNEDKLKYLSSFEKNTHSKNFIDGISFEIFNKKESDIFSVSRLETYISCPIKYFYKYILKIEDYFEPKTEVLKIGSAIHETLRILYEEYKINLNESLKNKKLIEDILKKELMLQDYTINSDNMDTVKRYVDLVDKTIEMDLEYLKNNNLKPISFEEKFIKSLEVEGEEIKFTGSIDRVDTDEYGNIYLVDYKLGASGVKNFDDFNKKAVSLQFPIYGLVKGARACRYITIANPGVHDFYNYFVEGAFDNSYLKPMEERLKEIVSENLNNIREEKFFEGAKNKSNCFFCEFKNFCKYR